MPLPVPSTWPFRLEQQKEISQGAKESGEPKIRRSADKGHGADSVHECIELVSKLKLCTNLKIGRVAAILATADEGPHTTMAISREVAKHASLPRERAVPCWL